MAKPKKAVDTLAFLTRKSAATCLAPTMRGSESWALSRPNALGCKYAVLCRNARHPDVEDKKPHGSGFMIGRIEDVVPSSKLPDRWRVTFSHFAEIDVPDLWKLVGGARNPILYLNSDLLHRVGLNLEALNWQPMPPPAEATGMSAEPAGETGRPVQTLPAAMDEAKRLVAAVAGVKPSAVTITIAA